MQKGTLLKQGVPTWGLRSIATAMEKAIESNDSMVIQAAYQRLKTELEVFFDFDRKIAIEAQLQSLRQQAKTTDQVRLVKLVELFEAKKLH